MKRDPQTAFRRVPAVLAESKPEDRKQRNLGTSGTLEEARRHERGAVLQAAGAERTSVGREVSAVWRAGGDDRRWWRPARASARTCARGREPAHRAQDRGGELLGKASPASGRRRSIKRGALLALPPMASIATASVAIARSAGKSGGLRMAGERVRCSRRR